MTKAPIHTVRFGLIKANVWRSRTRFGDRHNVTVCRLYKDGDAWRESNHFGRDDLLLLAKVLNEPHSWIFSHAADADGEGNDDREIAS